MLDYRHSRFTESHNVKIADGVNIGALDVGMALVVADTNGQISVKPSEGVAGEVFYGVAIFDRSNPSTMPQVARYVATGEAQTFALNNLISGSQRITANGETATTEATIANGVLTIPAATDAGTVIEVVYQATTQLTDMNFYGAGAGNLVGSALEMGADIGALRVGLMFVSNFDSSKEYTIGMTPKLGANGNFTVGGSGVNATGVIVASLPSEGSPFLGLEIAV